MSERELRRNLAILPIGTVRELTLLTDRQIRYYEQNELIAPNRGKGGQRRYSLNDVDRLLEIKDFLDDCRKNLHRLDDLVVSFYSICCRMVDRKGKSWHESRLQKKKLKQSLQMRTWNLSV
jgi:DNA-binding transcriptional MerR regulator